MTRVWTMLGSLLTQLARCSVVPFVEWLLFAIKANANSLNTQGNDGEISAERLRRWRDEKTTN